MDIRVPLLGTGSATPGSDHYVGDDDRGQDPAGGGHVDAGDAVRNRRTACVNALRNMSPQSRLLATAGIALAAGISTGLIIKATTDDNNLANIVGALVAMAGILALPAGRVVHQMVSQRLAQRDAAPAYV